MRPEVIIGAGVLQSMYKQHDAHNKAHNVPRAYWYTMGSADAFLGRPNFLEMLSVRKNVAA